MNILLYIGIAIFALSFLFQIYHILKLKKINENSRLSEEQKTEENHRIGKILQKTVPFDAIGIILVFVALLFGK